MTAEENNADIMSEGRGDMLIQQLLQLKRYERPETARMTRSRQNIMREIRKAQSNRRKTLGELMEINMPWFFAEPKYGIAAAFVAFAGLQFFGMNARQLANTETGIYTSTDNLAAIERISAVATNTISYPALPNDAPPLFAGEQPRQSDVKFVGRIEK
jgi:hypothetical protein